jgi:hypothetical protein
VCDNHLMNVGALLLALALEAAPDDARRFVRFRRRKTAFVATLLVRPEEFEMLGLVECDDGVDVLWRQTGQPRLTIHSI